MGDPYIYDINHLRVKGTTQMDALDKGNSVPRKIFHSRLGENKMRPEKSRWNIVT